MWDSFTNTSLTYHVNIYMVQACEQKALLDLANMIF